MFALVFMLLLCFWFSLLLLCVLSHALCCIVACWAIVRLASGWLFLFYRLRVSSVFLVVGLRAWFASAVIAFVLGDVWIFGLDVLFVIVVWLVDGY